MKKISRLQTEKEITNFFKENIEEKSPRQIKKIKTLAMSNNFPLKEFRKQFCKKCLTPYKKPRICIKNKIKSVTCENCGYISRWKLISN